MPPTTDRVALLNAIREARFNHGLICVHCHARRIQRWGTFSGRQRYRCCSCGRTFSDLTLTAAWYLKKIELLPIYALRMTEARAVRYEGRRMKIDKDTALRWRHRLLAGVLEHHVVRTRGVSGIVEVAESDFACVRRRRGHWWDPWRPPLARFLVMRDRGRVAWQARCLQPRITSSTFEAATAMFNPGATIVTSAGHLGPIATAVRRRRMAGIDISFRRGRRGCAPGTTLYHTRNVLEFVRREKRWLKRFRGISLRWALLYLGWFEMVDPATSAPTFEAMLMWPVMTELGACRSRPTVPGDAVRTRPGEEALPPHPADPTPAPIQTRRS